MKTQPLKALPFNRRTAPGTPADVYLRGRRGHDGATGVAKRTPAAHSRYMAAGIRAATLPIRTHIVATHYPTTFSFSQHSFFCGFARGQTNCCAACVGFVGRGGSIGGAGGLVAAAGWGALGVWAGRCRRADFHE